jgi:HK97 family phage portal protein
VKALLGPLLNSSPVPLAARATSLLFPSTNHNDATAQMRAMGSVGTLFAIVHATSNATSQVDWKLWRKAKSGRREDRTEITSHAALDLWQKPNKFTTRQELVEAGQQHVDLTGEGWLIVGRSPRAKIPLELWLVRPDRMAPVPHPTDFLSGYVYTGPEGEKVPLDIDQVLMLRMPNPLDPYRGMGPVQSILVDLDSTRAAAEYNRRFFDNDASPGGVIEFPEGISDEDFDQFSARWREQHQGVNNAHRVAIIEHGKWVDRSYSMRDMQFAELRQVSDDVILEAFGMPKFAVGRIDDVNRASAESATAWFAKRLTVPRLERWKAMLNHDLLPLFGATDVEFDYENPVPPDSEVFNAERDSKVTAAVALIGANFTAESVVKAFDLPATLVWEKPEPPPVMPPEPEDEPVVEARVRDDARPRRGFRQYWD